MMSSLREQAVAERCEGYAAFLHKPFRAAAVVSTVARVLGAQTTGASVAAAEMAGAAHPLVAIGTGG
jgi:hypothetical protein